MSQVPCHLQDGSAASTAPSRNSGSQPALGQGGATKGLWEAASKGGFPVILIYSLAKAGLQWRVFSCASSPARAIMLFALIPITTIRSAMSKLIKGSSYGEWKESERFQSHLKQLKLWAACCVIMMLKGKERDTNAVVADNGSCSLTSTNLQVKKIKEKKW